MDRVARRAHLGDDEYIRELESDNKRLRSQFRDACERNIEKIEERDKWIAEPEWDIDLWVAKASTLLEQRRYLLKHVAELEGKLEGCPECEALQNLAEKAGEAEKRIEELEGQCSGSD